jgi:branched-chain amino acid transport system substrate-binding protein
MGSMGSYDTGGFTVSYSSAQHHGRKYVELAMVTSDGKLR